MKKVCRLFYFLVILSMISCDKVDHPIVKKDTVVGSKFITKSNKTVSNFKKTLIEDYTGQRCPNCPGASSLIQSTLVPQYTNSLVVISVHAGSLSNPFAEYINQDFRTAAGNVWNGQSGFYITSWPTGLINRKNYASNGLLLSSTKWTSIVPLAQNDPFVVKLDLTTEYDTTARSLNTYVKATFKTAYPNSTKIIAVYIEDGIIGLQDDKGVLIEEYEFEYMLRGDINGTWGTDLKAAPAAVNDSINVSFANFYLPAEINPPKGKKVNDKNVSVVVFAYDAITREVLQVEKVKIR
jgi:hypothetical protein